MTKVLIKICSSWLCLFLVQAKESKEFLKPFLYLQVRFIHLVYELIVPNSSVNRKQFLSLVLSGLIATKPGEEVIDIEEAARIIDAAVYRTIISA